MSFWDGTRWVQETPSGSDEPRANWAATAVMLIGLVALLLPLSATSAASHRASDPGCSVNPDTADVGETYVVSAWGLPTGIAINLWVTEDGVTTGSPLGSTTDGTFDLNEASTTPGVATYTFTGPTKKHTTVYASCTVSAY